MSSVLFLLFLSLGRMWLLFVSETANVPKNEDPHLLLFYHTAESLNYHFFHFKKDIRTSLRGSSNLTLKMI
jgi:hypothetical protein